MPIGILGYGVYIPRYRIKGEEYARAWGSFAAAGVSEKSLPGYDEDVVTMAIEASHNALRRAQREGSELDAIYLATTSAPYEEKSAATTLAAALGAHEVRTADFGASTKAGTTALLAGLDRVRAEGPGPVLAVASDCPLAAPDSNLEHALGAGAAAFVLGEGDPVAVMEAAFSYARETLGERFRRQGEPYTRDLELRVTHFEEVLQTVIDGLLKRLGKTAADIDQVVLQQPDARRPVRGVAKFGFAREKMNLGHLVPLTGDTGAASTLLGLAAVLDQAQGSQRVVVASYGSGAGDALSLLTGEGLSARRGLAPTVADYLHNKSYVDYVTYLKLRRILSTAAG
ncbi:MAG TPA: hydroxymethylglutaryl-CoA synthase [Dehalococcoidia bacterium]|nr:hydroxymethylglutaryl-CoA synthase [Dehalococcoidia bacterium]